MSEWFSPAVIYCRGQLGDHDTILTINENYFLVIITFKNTSFSVKIISKNISSSVKLSFKNSSIRVRITFTNTSVRVESIAEKANTTRCSVQRKFDQMTITWSGKAGGKV